MASTSEKLDSILAAILWTFLLLSALSCLLSLLNNTASLPQLVDGPGPQTPGFFP